MRTLRILAEQPIGLLLGFAIASILFLAAFGLALTTGRVLATHDATGNVHACVSLYTGQARMMVPGQPPNCTASERLVEWPGTALAADIAELEARLEELACIQSAPGANSAVDDIVFTGCNVQIVNGLGDTETTNELGNLIVGYNEDLNGFTRTGSHNLVVGQGHGYSSYGGFVAGRRNQISGPHSSVSGGEGNIASGGASSISGGSFSTASDFAASVSGGFNNIASGAESSVSGGAGNIASGALSSVSGGGGNEASNARSSVSGGTSNIASGFNSSVSGGASNTASGDDSSVSGGENNTASGEFSSVSGGLNRNTNNIDPTHDWRGGSLIEDD